MSRDGDIRSATVDSSGAFDAFDAVVCVIDAQVATACHHDLNWPVLCIGLWDGFNPVVVVPRPQRIGSAGDADHLTQVILTGLAPPLRD